MRVGTVCYATSQGLAFLAKSFYDAGVIDEVLIWQHPSKGKRPTHVDWYPPGTGLLTSVPFRGELVNRFLESVDVVIFFETPFDWKFPDLCKSRGVKTVLIPMYEWFPKNPSQQFNKIFAPSLLDKDYFPGSTFIPIPVEGKYWKQREKAVRFLHNGGNIGCREHKGTRQLLEAIPHITSDAIVTVRAQDKKALISIVNDTFGSLQQIPKNLLVEPGEIPYESLWDGYDVLVQPEKFNGLSLPLQEARAAGMVVMTTNRYPTNTWLPKEPLIPVAEKTMASMGGHLEFEESTISPEDIARTIDEWYERGIVDYSRSGKEWAETMSWDALKQVYLRELEKVCLS